MLFEDSSNQIIESTIELWIFFYHNLIDDFSGFVVHNLVNSVISLISRGLQFLKQWVQQSQKCID